MPNESDARKLGPGGAEAIGLLQGAKRPTRDLDFAVALAAGWQRQLNTERRHGWFWRKGSGPWLPESGQVPPPFSSSLDAALSLLPPRTDWGCEQTGAGCCFAEAGKYAEAVEGATPAIALSIAALKLRESS